MIPGLGQALGGALGLGFMQNPSDAANPYFDQMEGRISPYLNPYIQAGTNALSTLQTQFGNLLNNPGQMFNNMGQNFQQSPGYNWQLNQGLGAANQAASAGGMLGSPMHQQQAQTVAQGLANQDYYNWMNQVQGMYGQGLQGMQGIQNNGLTASTTMANAIMNQLLAQAKMAGEGVKQTNENKGSGMGSIIGGLGSAFGFW